MGTGRDEQGPGVGGGGLSRTPRLLSAPVLPTARSGLKSLLKSAMTTLRGSEPVAKVCCAANVAAKIEDRVPTVRETLSATVFRLTFVAKLIDVNEPLSWTENPSLLVLA